MANSAGSLGWAARLRAAAAELESVGVNSAMGDARKLLSHALEIEPARLTMVIMQPPAPGAIDHFDRLIAMRKERRPVSQILGRRSFFGREFRVTSDVLDPRPDTETLVDVALSVPFNNLADLGTGSGCILLSLLAERRGARGVGGDRSRSALDVARKNACALDLTGRAEFVLSDWFEQLNGPFDLIVSNPPYIGSAEYLELEPELRHWEPKEALCPGGDGLNAYRSICAKASDYLNDEGHLILEIGPSQAQAVANLMASGGFKGIEVHQDIDGRDRVLKGQKSGNKNR